MQLAEAFANKSVDEIKEALAGATLKVYSCPQPPTPDKPIIRNHLLAEFTLGSPAFDGDQIILAPVPAKNVGTPLFSRATTADGATIADFSTGPGDFGHQAGGSVVLEGRARHDHQASDPPRGRKRQAADQSHR